MTTEELWVALVDSMKGANDRFAALEARLDALSARLDLIRGKDPEPGMPCFMCGYVHRGTRCPMCGDDGRPLGERVAEGQR